MASDLMACVGKKRELKARHEVAIFLSLDQNSTSKTGIKKIRFR